MTRGSFIATGRAPRTISIGVDTRSAIAPRFHAIAKNALDASAKNGGRALAVGAPPRATLRGPSNERLAELAVATTMTPPRFGFLRYNSFSDVGSDLSFTPWRC